MKYQIDDTHASLKLNGRAYDVYMCIMDDGVIPSFNGVV